MKNKQRQYHFKDEELTEKVLKKMLRELSSESYYRNWAKIKWKMTGKEPKRLTDLQTKQILQDYEDFQVPFQMYAKGQLERKNMCFFRYCFKKFCEKNGYTEFLQDDVSKFMKSTDNLAKNDRLFKKCFEFLGWPWRGSI